MSLITQIDQDIKQAMLAKQPERLQALRGIKVTGIHPGAVETEFSEVRFDGDKERAKKVYQGFEPLVAVDVAETIWFAASRPAHVNINELTVMPTAQGSAGNIFRKN